MIKFFLIGRKGCHLCDLMLSALELHPLYKHAQVNFIDIDLNPNLHLMYFDKIPVLLMNDEVVCESFFKPFLFEQAVKQALDHSMSK